MLDSIRLIPRLNDSTSKNETILSGLAQKKTMTFCFLSNPVQPQELLTGSRFDKSRQIIFQLLQ